ncbi:hypothetical protein HHUSO_G2466, partial [Huso huso]
LRNHACVIVQLENQDCVAIEVMYHHSCSSNYTNKKPLHAVKAQQEKNINETYKVFGITFRHLAEIQKRVIDGTEFLSVSYVQQCYIELLLDEGIEAPEYRTEKLKNKICHHFQRSVAFWHRKFQSQTEMNYSDMIPKSLSETEMMRAQLDYQQRYTNDDINHLTAIGRTMYVLIKNMFKKKKIKCWI